MQTHSSQEKIEEIGLDEYKIWTPAIPADGQANQAVIEILADYFNTAPTNIKIKSGNKSTHKLIEINNGL
ncbi:MAG TPA: DUF167 family protein [Methylomirabilota bacterium]|nr:DUF167 family protein [Methylomirabilota bacterium]